MKEPDAGQRARALEEISKHIPDEPLETVGAVNRTLAVAETVGTLISPVRAVDYLPQMHAVSFRYVFMNWTVEKYRDREYIKGDCYNANFTKGDNLALSQQGILALWRAAGGRDVSVERLDDRSDPLVAEVQVTVALRGIDGREVTTTKSREVDLRPGSPEASAMTDRQLAQAQQMIARNAETKAQLRAIRAALALPQMFPLATLERPFIIPVLVPLLDTDDPVLRRLVGAHALGVVGELYGAAATRALPEATPTEGGTVNGDGVFHPTEEAEVVASDDYGELPPEAEGPVCSCPCECGEALDDDAAEKSTALVGAPRCLKCFPSPKSFDIERHKDVGNLGLPKRPDLTGAKMAGTKVAS